VLTWLYNAEDLYMIDMIECISTRNARAGARP
jgi:hypothetical protein